MLVKMEPLFHHLHSDLQVLSLYKCGISDNSDEYYLAEKIDPEKRQERELNPSENPYNIQPRGQGILRLYIRYAGFLTEGWYLPPSPSPSPQRQNFEN